MRKGKKKEKTPVHVEPQYTLGLGYNPADPTQKLDAILGKHQARYMENIFNEMNKFTKTAVMTVVPDLFAQLLNVLKQEKQRLVAEQLDLEAGDDNGDVKETPVVDMKNPIEGVPAPNEKDVPKESEAKAAMRENNTEIVEKIREGKDDGPSDNPRPKPRKKIVKK